jgi:hypothetical protein
MDHVKILKQAWHNVWSYRALWIFGVIVALTTFSWGTMLLLDDDDNNETWHREININKQPGEDFFHAFGRAWREEMEEVRAEVNQANQELEEFFAEELNIQIESDILAYLIALVAMMLTFYTIAKVAGYVSEAALIRMVHNTAKTGVQHSVRQGLRMGFSRTAWRLFLINLLVNTTAVLTVILLMALPLLPLLLWTTGATAAGVLGTIMTVVMFFPVLALIIVAGATVSMLKQFFRRSCAVEGLGVIASIRRGYALARGHLKDVTPMWIVTIVVSIAWPFLMVPIAILFLGVGVVLGGAGALLAGGLASLTFDGATPWILAGAVGIPVFLLTLAAPLVFLGGLREVFLSSTWTLTYRELRAVEGMERTPKPEALGLEAATAA